VNDMFYLPIVIVRFLHSFNIKHYTRLKRKYRLFYVLEKC